ncbi:MAG TPA: NAD(P)/FAD-dependent oxidoreductase [Geobacteraceae bacterium]
MAEKKAIIIGAGPAGLTAAYELLDRTDITPIVFEMSDDIGGISKTAKYRGNRIDIGGHRFFSKSERVMAWWQNLFPLQGAPARDDIMLDRPVPLAAGATRRELRAADAHPVEAPDPEKTDLVFLIRRRLSRIFFLRKFFPYPVTLNPETVANLGVVRIVKIGLSYVKASLFPIKEEKSLEDFFINRFGTELYETFFKDYTQKVWGVPCSAIKPEWGAQRIKGLSITTTLVHAVKSILRKDTSIDQKKTETSLIEQFMYPKLGPGQLWEEVARQIAEHGGKVVRNQRVVGIVWEEGRIVAVRVRNEVNGAVEEVAGDYFFSTMPVKELVAAMGDKVPEDVGRTAEGLVYRDFITVGLLLKKLKVENRSGIKTVNDIIPDNWIYIQERDVRLGRVQVFNNWSPYMVEDAATVWLGLEYFCTEGDDLWTMADDNLASFAAAELAKIDFIIPEDILDSVVIRVPKAYPAYFGSYDDFSVIREFTDRFANLFLIGRNGMHRYNNADHSMLTAMVAVDNIASGIAAKENIWAVNTEGDYHEGK